VRPECHPQLSQFCKLLTGIQQAEVCVEWVPFNLRPYCNHFCALFFHWLLLNISCDITAEISCTMECSSTLRIEGLLHRNLCDIMILCENHALWRFMWEI
jgi:hypothetical protein